VLASGMLLRSVVTFSLICLPVMSQPVMSQPVMAQPVMAPDCTVSVEVKAGPTLDLTYRCRATHGLTLVADDEQIAQHVSDLSEPNGNHPEHLGDRWQIASVNGLAEARYHYDLAAYARAVDTPRSAVLRGEGVLVNLPGWLLEPQGYDHTPVIDIRVHTAPGLVFAAGLPKVGDAWRINGTRVSFAGYTVIGRLHLEDLAVPAPGSLRPGEPRRDAVLQLAILDGPTEAGRADLVDWVKRTVEAESQYWQGFTGNQLLLTLVPIPGRRGVGYGRTEPGGGATVMVELGLPVEQRRLFDDWVLVHELVHSGMPYFRGRATWFMEGAATYVEPIIRARAGWKTEAEVWKEWLDNMPRNVGALAVGLANARGNQNYYGGALFMLMADLGMRRDTNGKKGLEDCLGGVLWSGVYAYMNVRVPDYAKACDMATGTKVMTSLVDKYYLRGEAFDLDAFWRELGVSEVGGVISLDDKAPLAQWRKMIVMGPPDRPPHPVKLPWES
jgi:hypothetical protein